MNLQTDRQTDEQTEKRLLKHNLFGGSNQTTYISTYQLIVKCQSAPFKNVIAL